MLDIFHNGFNIDDIGTLAKEFKFTMHLMHTLMEISPVVRDIVNAAAEKNAELRILLKLSSGKYPDLKDMFELATGNHGNLVDDLNAEAKKNKVWQEMNKLELSPMQNSIKILELFTGQNSNPNTVQEIQVGTKYTLTHSGINPNVYKMMQFFINNGHDIKQIKKLVGKPPTDYVTVLQLLTKMDYSSFPTNVQPNKNMATDDHGPRPDPEIQGFLHDVKVRNPQILSTPNAKAEAEAAVTSELGSFLNIVSATLNLLKPNEETGKSDMAGNAGQK